MDLYKNSDPMIVLFEESAEGWLRIDRTEVIRDNANPVFKDKFIVVYDFKKDCSYKFRVYDVDDFQNIDDLEE